MRAWIVCEKTSSQRGSDDIPYASYIQKKERFCFKNVRIFDMLILRWNDINVERKQVI